MAENKQTNKKWLIISYFSRQSGRACSHHIDGRMRELKKNGITPVIVSGVCKNSPPLPFAEEYSAFSFSPAGIRYEIRYRLKRKYGKNSFKRTFLQTFLLLPLLPFYAVESIFKTNDLWSWGFSAAFVSLYAFLRHKPRIIYSSAGPASTHIAAAFCSFFTRAPWVAELLDPIVFDEKEASMKSGFFERLVEKTVCAKADGIVFLTSSAEKKLKTRRKIKGKTTVIYHGASSSSVSFFQEPLKTKKITLLHLGTLMDTRNLNSFFKAIDIIKNKNNQKLKNIKLIHCGFSGNAVREEINKYKEEIEIYAPGQLSREESFKFLKQSDALLLVQHLDPVSRQTIPSKVYEYFLTGKPILALVYENPELSNLLEEYGHFTAPLDKPALIAKALEKMYIKWENQESFKIKTDNTEIFTAEYSARKLIGFCGKFIEKKAFN